MKLILIFKFDTCIWFSMNDIQVVFKNILNALLVLVMFSSCFFKRWDSLRWNSVTVEKCSLWRLNLKYKQGNGLCDDMKSAWWLIHSWIKNFAVLGFALASRISHLGFDADTENYGQTGREYVDQRDSFALFGERSRFTVSPEG